VKQMSRYFILVAAAVVSTGGFRVVATHAAAAGSLAGIVKLEGPAPKRTPISMAREPTCASMHGTAPLSEDFMVDANGDLENVVVYVSEGLPESIPDSPQEPVIITQKGCTYVPHVIAIQTTQKLRIVNGDATSHNIHPMPNNNSEWNKSQPVGAAPFEESFTRQEIGIPVKCNVHSWMRAYISVFRHPYFSVTNEKGGFHIQNLPPGNYTISAWHEKLGTQTQKITVAAGEAKTLQFVFKARPAS
jgi:Carboxypeptidase regulatory-like domain